MGKSALIGILLLAAAVAGCASTPYTYLGGIQQPVSINQAPVGATVHSEADKVIAAAKVPEGRININIETFDLQCGPLNGTAVVVGSFFYSGRTYRLEGRGEVRNNALSGFNKSWVCSAAMGQAIANGVLQGLRATTN